MNVVVLSFSGPGGDVLEDGIFCMFADIMQQCVFSGHGGDALKDCMSGTSADIKLRGTNNKVQCP
jgi:hypothetical protein